MMIDDGFVGEQGTEKTRRIQYNGREKMIEATPTQS